MLRVRPAPMLAVAGLFALLAILAPLAAKPVSAQQNDAWRLGLGAGFTPFSGAAAVLPPIQVYVPVERGSFRFEAQAGHASHKRSVTQQFGGFNRIERTVTTLGAGLFFRADMDRDTRLYVGPRVGVQRTSTAQSFPAGATEHNQTNAWYGVATGGEYLLSPSFSLGAELQYLYADADDEDTRAEGSVSGTQALLFVRWFLLGGKG